MHAWTSSDTGEDELDEFDPLRAPSLDLGDADQPPVDEDPLTIDQRPLIKADGTFDEDRGFASAASVIRVWIDDEGVINKVRVSPSWRERVAKNGGPAALATGLSRSFDQAFALINIARRPEYPTTPIMGETAPAQTPLSWAEMARIQQALHEVRDQVSALDSPQEGRWTNVPAVGTSAGGKVKVELNEFGGYDTVHFDPTWLHASRVGQICDAVPEAARRAKERFVPPVYEPSEYDQLMEKSAALRSELTAMMKRGIR